MENLVLLLATLVIVILNFLFILNKKLFYYALIVVYPVIGQLIGFKFNVLGVTLNPSMIFGMIVFGLTAIDFILLPMRHLKMDLAIVVFIAYALVTSVFSPVRFESLSWTLKIATWLLILSAAMKLFKDESDFQRIHLTVCIAAVLVIISFFLSYFESYGGAFVYETGVESHGAGFSSGKTLAYYLAFTIPILAWNTDRYKSLGALMSYTLISVALVVIILTFVRAPVVALLIGFAAFQFFSFKYGGKSFSKVFLIMCVLIAVLSSVYFTLGQSRIVSRWAELGEKYQEGKIDKLGSGRVGGLVGFYEYYVHRASWSKRIFGSGLGSSHVHLGTTIIIHNDFAEILTGCGMLGFSIYVFIMVRLFKLLKRSQQRIHEPNMQRLGALALSNFFVFLAFHMTNATSGVFYLSMWAIATGSVIGREQASYRRHELVSPKARDAYNSGTN